MIAAMRRGTLALFVAAVLVAGMAGGAVEAQIRPTDAQDTAPRILRIDVTIGKSQVLDFKDSFNHISVTNPVIADIFVVTPNQVLIHGKAAGVTSLVVLYPDKTMYFDVVVQTDIGLLKERIKTIVPRDEIEVRAAKDSIIINGTVGSEELVGQVGQIAEIFAPKKVVNLLKVGDVRTQQVLLQVHVAEVSRSAMNELGFSFRAIGRSFMGAAWPGSVFVPGVQSSGSLGNPPQLSRLAPGTSSPPSGPNFAFTDLATFFFANGTRDYAGIVRALTQKELLRTLAKPNLITVSGKEAKFLSGGEFPIPVPSPSGTGVTVTIDYKPFGVQLAFTPLEREDLSITLKVAPEVSSLDFSQGLTLSGFTIPAIRSNRAAATLELKDGETFAMAGLINTNVRQQVAKIPLLGDIPILGTLFRSTAFVNDETELLFLVTPRLVKAFAPGEAPDPAQLFELRESERDRYTGINTLVPGIPDVGMVIDRPFGESNLPGGKPAAK